MAQDPENPEATDAELAEMRPARDALPPALDAALVRRGGRPKAEARKVPVTIRLDPHIVGAFRATGPDWQTRMIEAPAEAASKLTVARRLA